MLVASADRTVFSCAQVPLARELGLDNSALGFIANAFLLGYGMTQVAGGALADRLGGPKVLVAALGLWSAAMAALPAFAGALHVPRFVFGAASGVALPAASATVAATCAPDRRAAGISTVFTLFNCGSAVGFLVGGLLVSGAGWQVAVGSFGAAGLALAAASALLLSRGGGGGAGEAQAAAEGAPPADAGGAAGESGGVGRATLVGQLACMCWVHMAVNWGFFILQNWLPLYLSKQFSLGALSGPGAAVPWGMTALCTLAAGVAAERLSDEGWAKADVRRAMSAVATLGPAASMLLLPSVSSAPAAIALLCTTLGLQAFSVSGYHAYVQDVAPGGAGAVLGLTNTLGVLTGLVGNVVVGRVLDATGSFSLIFYITAAVYASSFAVFTAFLRGTVILPAKAS